MSAADILGFVAPEFAALPAGLLSYALSIAEPYRPACLPEAKGDEAVALYAAWLLSVRACGGAAGGGTIGPLLMEREGDQQRQYGGARDTTLSAAQMGNYKARYDALARLCASGAIMTRFSGSPLPLVGVPNP